MLLDVAHAKLNRLAAGDNGGSADGEGVDDGSDAD